MAFVRVDRIIASIADINSGKSREPCVEILPRNEVRNQQVCQSELGDGVSQKKILCPSPVQRPLQLKSELPLTRREDGILFVVLTGCGQARSPVRPPEIRIRKHQRCTPVERSRKPAEGDRLGLSANVVERVFKIDARSLEALLAGLESRRQSDGRQAGQRHRPRWYAAAAVDELVSKTVGDGIAIRFVHFDYEVFSLLGGYLAPRIDIGPVENACRVEPAFGEPNLQFRQRLAGL